ncbi:hypothetical protein AK812_SmicGene25346 [Symbiodinium microadriaticum]|uniref:OsmC-like protein n=1 Tax=Symbiodinium microadriaticum TaxID=2951 RepID=A0A1Q9DC99_SYMMI|nr:hypothetical protein AK812_SmicGene25346 [Symbiodinium microadriaticum]
MSLACRACRVLPSCASSSRCFAGTAAASVLRQRPPRWKRYHLVASGAGCATASETDDGYKLQSDTPTSAGGTGTAPQPVQLLLAALVGCEQATAHFLATKLRLPPIRRIEFDIHAERDEWGSLSPPVAEPPAALSRLQRITGTATVFTDASEEQVRAVAAGVKLRCPVASMIIDSGCELDVRWVKAKE